MKPDRELTTEEWERVIRASRAANDDAPGKERASAAWSLRLLGFLAVCAILAMVGLWTVLSAAVDVLASLRP